MDFSEKAKCFESKVFRKKDTYIVGGLNFFDIIRLQSVCKESTN
jgi:hypothetical protein